MNNILIRFFDILISILMLIIFFPFVIIISLLILVFNGQPIIFKQNRIGYKGIEFKLLKFRTMHNLFVKNENLRVTPLGKILRKTSLDEIPQFINVLKKDMSIVGPRPLPKKIEVKINSKLRIKRRKVLPGITGMSQINYNGKKRELIEKIKLDINFVNNHTLFNYFKILFKTPHVLIIRYLKNKSSIIR
tara:strand:- start:489 stop:1058 length:570 start_codon:yes stop_codon:yes gene_type:complete